MSCGLDSNKSPSSSKDGADSKDSRVEKWNRTLEKVRTVEGPASTLCPECGAANFPGSRTCRSCNAPLSTSSQDESWNEERWERAARRSQRQASDDLISYDMNWKFRLLPILAVIALIAILIGNLLQEDAQGKLIGADTLQELVDASENARVASRVIQIGIIILALVVAGISVEYRRQ